jgi:hypothetical protein
MVYRGPGFPVGVQFCSSLTPSSPYSVSKLTLNLNISVCRRSSLLTEKVGEGVGKEQNHWRESLVLFKSFNTLWMEVYTVHYYLWSDIK